MVIKNRRKLLNALLLALLAGFIVLTILVLIDPLPKIDREFSEEVQEHSSPVLDTVMRAISWAGYMPGSIIVIGVTALGFFVFKYRREALFTLLTALSGLISTVIKFIVNRPRPLPSMVRVIEKTQQQSFPSGHVLFYTVFFGFMIIVFYGLKQLQPIFRGVVISICIILILLIPLSRIYLGAHWFTDVTAAFFLGALFLYALAHFYLRLST